MERRSAVIVVTHDERMIAGFDTVKRLRDGRLVDGEAVTSTAQERAEGLTATIDTGHRGITEAAFRATSHA